MSQNSITPALAEEAQRNWPTPARPLSLNGVIETAPPPALGSRRPMSQPDSARSLVIEDTSEHIRVVVAILRQAGDQLSSAKNGPQGLAIAAENLPGLIPLDSLTYHVDGFEARRRFMCEARSPVEWRGISDAATAGRVTGGA